MIQEMSETFKLTSDEVARIVSLGERFPETAGKIMVHGPHIMDNYNPNDRKVTVNWIRRMPQSEWLFKRIAEEMNVDPERIGTLQYSRYAIGDHFVWHTDNKYPRVQWREISISAQLSETTEYEGGDLEFACSDGKAGDLILRASRELGAVTAFPSWCGHRVTPVTHGLRKALVVWIAKNGVKPGLPWEGQDG